MPRPTKNKPDPKRRGRLKMLLVAALCALPVIASYFAYYVWQPTGHVNYGELVELHPLPDIALKQLDGEPFRLGSLKGKWVLLSIDSGVCATACQDKLLMMRQLRLMQGRDMERIERAFLITDDKPLTTLLLREFDGTRMVRVTPAEASALLQALPAADSPEDHIYLADPYGNVMLRFPPHPDPNRAKKDLERLFRAQGTSP
jgi:hypothetical protein